MLSLMVFSALWAQPIKSGDKYWDGAILYTAKVYSNGSLDLIGKDINGDSYEITLLWTNEDRSYSVFSRNGAIALRIDEGAKVKIHYRDRVGNFLVFHNAKGEAAWTMEYYLSADIQGLTAYERKLEQQNASEVITTTPINTTWLARFPKPELRIMRNEILARHGWSFQSKDLQEYFKEQPWYEPVQDNSSIKISVVERTNLEMIKSEEATPDEYRYSMVQAPVERVEEPCAWQPRPSSQAPVERVEESCAWQSRPSSQAPVERVEKIGRGPDEIDGIKTYTITNEREFLAALGPDRTIVVAKNVHLNLSRVLENENLFINKTGRRWMQSGADFIGQLPLVISEGETDGQQLDIVNINNLTIRGAGNSSIEVDPRYSYCLYFINCENCRVENLTIGHTEYGYCSGGVIGVKKGKNIEILNCDLYGCGTYGLDLMDCHELEVRKCRIHHCTYGIMQLSKCHSISFSDCDFFQNKEYDLIEGRNCAEVSFANCRFYNNSESTLFNFNTKFKLEGCEVYHPLDKLGTMNMVVQSGKKNTISSNSETYDITPREIGPDQQSPDLLPMFLYIMNKNYMLMVYWTDVEEPKYDPEYAEYYEADHASWELQEIFRKNASQFTNLVTKTGKIYSLEYKGEILKDPKGNKMYPGELHSRPSIPSPGLKYAFANPKNTLPKDNMWGMWVVVTDNYLRNHTFIPLKDHYDKPSPLPAKVIMQLESKYNMKSERSRLVSSNGRYSYGVMQFKGAWKTRVEEYGDTTRVALALEVFIVGDEVYAYPMEGHYDPSFGPTWNADDDGEYFPGSVIAFDGPDGPDFCHFHSAPESLTVGVFSIRNGKLSMKRYDVYHSLYDEDEPNWND